MRSAWPTSTIGDLCTITSGGTPSKGNESYWKGSIPWVTAKDLKSDHIADAALHISKSAVEHSATKIAPAGSLLMLVRGMGLANGFQIGEVAAPVAFNQDIRAIHPPANVVPRFLLLALRSALMNGEASQVMSSAAHGTLKIDAEALRGISFPVPPLAEQRRIVKILDEAFAGIAVAKRNAEQNLQNARALFESHLEAIFSPGWNWPIRNLGEICTFEGGAQPPKSQFIYQSKQGYVRFLQIRDFANDKHVTYIPASKKNRLCNVDDIMIGRYGASVGKVLTGKDGAYNVALMKASPDQTLLDRAFFYHYLTSGSFQQRLVGVASRSAQDGFSKDDIYEFPVPSPPLSEQRKLVARIEPVKLKTQHLAALYQQKLTALDDLKKSLLARAFAGELTSAATDAAR